MDDYFEYAFVLSDFILQIELVVATLGALRRWEEDRSGSMFDVEDQLRVKVSNTFDGPVNRGFWGSHELDFHCHRVSGFYLVLPSLKRACG